MKIGLVLGLNVLMVGAGLLAYDVIRGDASVTELDAADQSAELIALQDRMSDLEQRLDGLPAGDSDRRLSTRLLQLEGRMGALESGRSLATADSARVADEVDGTAAAVASALNVARSDPDAPLAAKEIERVKEALAQVESERERERAARMVEGLVERLGLSLTEDQQKRLGDELAAFREKARDTFRNARGAGLTREDVMATFDTLRGELATELEDFLPASDAQAISDEIGSGGRMMGGGPGRGPGGGGGR